MGESGQNGERRIAGPRLIAIVGPFQSGKTSLLESLLVRAGGAARQGSVRDGTSVGDSSPEARSHAMSVEPNVASVDYMGDRFTFVDCPGSVEFIHDMRSSCRSATQRWSCAKPTAQDAGAAGDPARARRARRAANRVPQQGRPRRRQRARSARDAAARFARAAAAATVPIFENGVATGFVDLALERAFVYRESAPSETVAMPAGLAGDEKQARYNMLERLADYDDALMEQQQRLARSGLPRLERSARWPGGIWTLLRTRFRGTPSSSSSRRMTCSGGVLRKVGFAHDHRRVADRRDEAAPCRG